jgi:hypothetical protein
MGRLFGIPLFIAGIIFLRRYWKEGDHPKAAAKYALKSVWVWFFFILCLIGFVAEAIWLARQPLQV